jgi:endoglucanase
MKSQHALLALAVIAGTASAADIGSPGIFVNQIGYFPDLPKIAATRFAERDSSFQVVAEPGGQVVLEGFGSARAYWAASEDSIRNYDFSGLRTPGTYRIKIPGVGVSYPFRISQDVYTEITKASIKSYYYQRSSTALLATHAGQYARAAGHPDNAVEVHNSAATATRPAKTKISSPKGWYDAGDYGKYIVNSGITTWTLLDLYTQAPDFFDTLNLNIPESGNELPDLLDEILWNVDWMRTMQDLDGGVYHKLTTASFSGFVMPANDRATRYVVQKGTAATLDFAAVMAQTSRIFRRFESVRPGFADSCLQQALRAWSWARRNPAVSYDQSALANPAVSTGGYGDGTFSDELAWAAMELTIATGLDSFWRAAHPTGRVATTFRLPGWNQVAALGLMSSLSAIDSLVGKVDTSGLRSRMMTLAREATVRMANPLLVPVRASDFYWGSTSVTGNVGLLALHGYRISQDTTLRNAALAATDWILGRNALSVSFVTGHGAVTPMYPHHRPSGADGIAAPIPGFIVGGPNNSKDDAANCNYQFTQPALSWTDEECSFASNEVAINWNAPLTFLLGVLQAGENRGWVSKVGPRAIARKSTGLIARSHGSDLAVRTLDGSAILEVQVLAANGRVVAGASPGTSSWTLVGKPSGLLLVRARTAKGWSSLSTASF